MKVEVRITKSFKKDAKSIAKKYPSLFDDLEKLEAKLIKNPTLGTSLGKNTYKIRLKINSKNTGSSGGARVISFLENEIFGLVEETEDLIVVNLIAIYDKSEKASISNKELQQLIKNMTF